MGVKKRDLFVVDKSETLQGNHRGWVWFTTFWYNGEPYEFGSEIGGAHMTDQQAIDQVRALKCREKAMHGFLREVELDREMAH